MTQRAWTEQNEFLSTVDEVLTEHEEAAKRAVSIIPSEMLDERLRRLSP